MADLQPLHTYTPRALRIHALPVHSACTACHVHCMPRALHVTRALHAVMCHPRRAADLQPLLERAALGLQRRDGSLAAVPRRAADSRGPLGLHELAEAVDVHVAQRHVNTAKTTR